MRNHLENILTGEQDDLNGLREDDLLKYLEGRLAPDEVHALEQQMVDSAFVNDALEGLQQFPAKETLHEYVRELNKQLQQQLQAKKQKKAKRTIRHLSWPLLAVAIILLLCLLGYAVLLLFGTSH